jgi:hypothetical protein
VNIQQHDGRLMIAGHLESEEPSRCRDEVEVGSAFEDALDEAQVYVVVLYVQQGGHS